MADHSYSIEVQTDFLEKITRAKPVQALAEFIWNGLDADASKVDVSLVEGDLGGLSEIVIRDNGTGMEHARAPELFRSLGGSWKLNPAALLPFAVRRGQDGPRRGEH